MTRADDPPATATPDFAVPAGLVTRVMAAGIDIGVVLGMGGVVYLCWAALQLAWLPTGFQWPQVPAGWGFLALVVLAIGYQAVLWATSGRTYGGVVMGLRVVSGRGVRLGWVRALLRAVLTVAIPIGLGLVAVSRRRRSFADVVVRSAVVHDWHHTGSL